MLLRRITQRVILIVTICLCLVTSTTAGAASLTDEWEETSNLYLFSAICRAAYTDQRADMLLELLRDEGWVIETYFQEGDKADAKFFMASRPNNDGRPPLLLLAVAGTESKKDIKVDLTFDKTPFVNVFSDEPNDQPINGVDGQALVHKGFLRYVKTALTARPLDQPSLVEELQAHPEQKIYLVGHSLGGAVATLGGATLLTLGVPPEQVEIVTFGAPPVGNQAFVDAFNSRLHLTRIVTNGDPVAGFLLDMVGGYRQFGREVKYAVPQNEDKSPHSMAIYGDVITKRYFDVKKEAEQAGVIGSERIKVTEGKPVIYLAPLTGTLPTPLQGEFPYMQDIAMEIASHHLPGYVAEMEPLPTLSLSVALKRASAAGADAVLMTDVQVERMQQEKNTYYVTATQRVYRVNDGVLVSYSTMGSNTNELTVLQAFSRGVADELLLSSEWLNKLK